jgi:hypothetical protein
MLFKEIVNNSFKIKIRPQISSMVVKISNKGLDMYIFIKKLMLLI